MVTVKAIAGWEDPRPFWDDDGQAYLVHSKKAAGPLILHKMSADGTQFLKTNGSLWLRGVYRQDRAELWYSLHRQNRSDSGRRVTLKFGAWKGARFGIFCYGSGGGFVDVDYAHYRYGSGQPVG